MTECTKGLISTVINVLLFDSCTLDTLKPKVISQVWVSLRNPGLLFAHVVAKNPPKTCFFKESLAICDSNRDHSDVQS